MGWLKDLLSFRKSYCCGDDAKRQQIARKWSAASKPTGLIDKPSKRAKKVAEYYIENTPVISKFVMYGEAVQLKWAKESGVVTLYIHPTHSKLDMLNIEESGRPSMSPSIEKIKELLS